MTLSFTATLVAGIVSLFIGYLWYHPRLFGARWMRSVNVTPEMANARGSDTWMRALIALIASMVAAYAIAIVGMIVGVHEWTGALVVAFGVWLGFLAPTMLTTALWERRPRALFFIDSFFWLVSFCAMALTLLVLSGL